MILVSYFPLNNDIISKNADLYNQSRTEQIKDFPLKQRNIADIQLSRFHSDNKLQLPAHTVNHFTLIYKIRVNISIQGESY